MPKRKQLSHLKISEKEPGQKELLIKHRHPRKTKGKLTFTNSENKVLNIDFSADCDENITSYPRSFSDAYQIYWIVHSLYLAVDRKNPNICFFYISGVRKSTFISKSDLNHVPNKILTVLKALKKEKDIFERSKHS